MLRTVALAALLVPCLSLAQDVPAADTPAPAATLAPTSAPERDVLRESLHLWHRGERVSGFVPFLGSGLGSALAGTFLVTSDSQAGKGGGWVLIGFGALEVAAGLAFALSSFGAEERRDLELTQDRAAFIEKEKARLKRITTLYQPLLLGIEAAVAAGGGITAGIGGLQRNETMVGVGLGLAVQGVLFFLLDWAVSDRAQAYALALGL
jgi:hypothetical protein